MSNMREALKRAGLLDEKTNKRLQHEERVKRKKLGRQGMRAEEDRRQQDHRRRDDQKKAQVRSAQQSFAEQKDQRENLKRVNSRITSEEIRAGLSGPRRFHYRNRHGLLPYLAVNDAMGRRLEGGEVGIVESNAAGAIAVVPRDVAQELQALSPERVLHLNGGGA